MKLTEAHEPWAIWGPPGNPTSNQRLLMGWKTLIPNPTGNTLLCCGLNPSTAWASNGVGELDPTLTRLHGFAVRWGLARVVMMNLYPHRSTNPKEMWPELVKWSASSYYTALGNLYDEVAFTDGVILAGWGNTKPPAWSPSPYPMWTRDLHTWHVKVMLRGMAGFAPDRKGQVMCLGTTKDGHPRHPLYVKGDTEPVPFVWER